MSWDETDSIIDALRERRRDEAVALAEFAQPDDTPTLTAQEEARIQEMSHGQTVVWDRYRSIEESDWRSHGIA